MLYHILARFNLQFVNLLHIIILVAWQAWHKFKDESTFELRSFFLSFHIYKNLPRIAVFRKLKCPDPSMIPLPAENKECLQKSIRLTSYTPFNQLIHCISVSSYMLTRRFAVHLNRSLVERLGIVIEKTEVAYLRSFPCAVVKKTFEVTCGDGRVKSIPNAYLGIGKRVPQIVRKTQITRPVN